MNKEEFDILMKKLYPDPEFREVVIKGAKIVTCLAEEYKLKTKESENELTNAIEAGKRLLAKIDKEEQ